MEKAQSKELRKQKNCIQLLPTNYLEKENPNMDNKPQPKNAVGLSNQGAEKTQRTGTETLSNPLVHFLSLVRQLPLPLPAGTIITWNLDYISQHILQLSVTKLYPMG